MICRTSTFGVLICANSVIDVIKDGVNGVLVPVNDVDKLAGTIAGALNVTGKRDAIGRSARETITSRFTLEKELRANLDVYQTLRGSLK